LSRRHGLREAVELVEAGKAGVIVGAYFDRLVRSLNVQAELVGRVEAKGGRVLALDTGEITNGSAGQWLSGTMLGAVAEYQRRTTAERTRVAQVNAVARGVPPYPGAVPGYTRADNGPLVPHPRQRKVVAEGFRMRGAGATVNDVRAYWREHGIRLGFSGVQRFLGSRVVLGELHFGDLSNLKAHTAIVRPDVWQRAQDVRVPRGRRAKSQELLARLGVLRCGTCGARMVVATSNGHRTYRCPATSDCPRRMSIMAHMADEYARDRVREEVSDAKGRASLDAQARAAKMAADGAEDALARATRIALAAGVSEEATAVEQLEGLRLERDRSAARAAELALLSGSEVVTVADLERADMAKWRRLIRATLVSVTVGPGRGVERLSFEPRRQQL
jgi:hypothetical protein